MKISLIPVKREHLDRQTAWGCLTANLAVPGAGSLAAGRLSGYLQFALAIAGTVLTLFYGTHFVIWYIHNFSRFQGGQIEDPLGYLLEVWMAVRWALLGFGLFGFAWLWGLLTGLSLLRRAKSSPPPLV